MTVGKILNSKKETVCSDLIVSAGWATRAGHQDRGDGWTVLLSWHPEISHHTWCCCSAQPLPAGSWRWAGERVNLCRAGSPFIPCQPTLPGGAHVCARPSTAELLGLLALLWGHPSALQRLCNNSRAAPKHGCWPANSSSFPGVKAVQESKTSNQIRIKPSKPDKNPKNPSPTQTHPCLIICIWLQLTAFRFLSSSSS